MDAKEEIKGRLSIEDVVSEYVQLKRAGRNFKGLSPFTNEKTPSFIVSPDKQIWHDFSSGQGGDMFSFVMAVEGIEFKDALELLARKAGVNLEDYQRPGGSKGPDKAKLHQLIEASTHFYQRQFAASNLSMTYVFKTRQFTKQTALDWRLGYAPNTGDALVKFLKKLGYTDQQLKLAGVTGRSGRDMFRSRLMIPLADGQGQVIGFTARLLGDDKNQPKYINTPATPLYDKSRHVFGLHYAKAAIREAKFAVLVEGNLDVIMSHQAGVKNVVATAGTALTEFQLKALGRLTGDIRLCFDADRAGLDATERAIPLASKAKVSLSVITIPSGKDPDELIKQDKAKWLEIIQQPVYALDWLIARYEKLFDLTSAEGKRKFTDKILEVIKTLSDPVEQDHYLGQLAEKLDASKQALADKMAAGNSQTAKPLKRAKPAQNTPDKAQLEYQKQQDGLLAIALMFPKLRHYLDIVQPDMFSADWQKNLLKFIKDNPDFSGQPDELKKLSKVAEDVKIKQLKLQFEELYQGISPQDMDDEVLRLRARLAEAYVKYQKQQLVQKMNSATEIEYEELLIKVKDLDNLLRQTTIRR